MGGGPVSTSILYREKLGEQYNARTLINCVSAFVCSASLIVLNSRKRQSNNYYSKEIRVELSSGVTTANPTAEYVMAVTREIRNETLQFDALLIKRFV